jgi:RHS repeat-associated protein
MYVSATRVMSPASFTPTSSTNFNSANRLLIQNSAYDLAGNQTAIGGFAFSYDHEGRVKTSTLNSIQTNYTYDGNGRRVTKSTGARYLTADHLGSTRLVTKDDGTPDRRIDYLPFGEFMPATVGGRTTAMKYEATETLAALTQRFTGKERDAETGLDYFGLRQVSTSQGRFTTTDPNGAGASLFDPQTWNSYSYVNNRPLSYIDPDGDIPIPVITGLAGAGVGALVSGGGEVVKQYAQEGRITNWGKVGTAIGGGALSGGLAGLTLGFGAGAGAAAVTTEVVMVNASSSVIGGYAQRRADEALGYDAPAGSTSELASIGIDALTGGAFGFVGGKFADHLFPIPNVKREIEILRFANRRSTRATRIQAAQRQAELKATFNSFVGGMSSGIPTEGTKWALEWLVRNLRPEPKKKEVVTSRICYAEGACQDLR